MHAYGHAASGVHQPVCSRAPDVMRLFYPCLLHSRAWPLWVRTNAQHNEDWGARWLCSFAQPKSEVASRPNLQPAAAQASQAAEQLQPAKPLAPGCAPLPAPRDLKALLLGLCIGVSSHSLLLAAELSTTCYFLPTPVGANASEARETEREVILAMRQLLTYSQLQEGPDNQSCSQPLRRQCKMRTLLCLHSHQPQVAHLRLPRLVVC